MKLLRLRVALFLIGLMALTYGYSYWMISDNYKYLFGPFFSIALGLPTIVVVPIVSILSVAAILFLRKPIYRMMSTALIVVTIVITTLFTSIQFEQTHFYEFVNPTSGTKVLVEESVSWLSTEFKFYGNNQSIAWVLESEGQSTSTLHTPFRDGDFDVNWLGEDRVQITWLFDNDSMTTRTIVFTVDGILG